MILTTTSVLQNKEIIEYKGLVCGEVVEGINALKDFAAGLSNFFGGRSDSYENEVIQARDEAVAEMTSRAEKLGANAIIGIDIDYEMLGEGGSMVLVSVSGTAVVVK